MRIAFVAAAAVALAGVLPAQGVNAKGMLTTTGAAGDVDIPDSPALVPSTGYTIEAWFYYDPAAPGGNVSPTILRKNSGSPPSYLLRLTSTSNGHPEFYANATGGFTSVVSPAAAPVLSWHHMAGTHDGLVARLFVDGVQVASQTCVGGPFFVAGDLRIAKGAPSSESWRGSIDEVRLWSVAKTAAQIQASMFTELNTAPNLVAAWHFNGNYTDSAGGHNGVPNGQVTVVPSTSPVVGTYITAPAIVPIGAVLQFQITSAATGVPYVFDVSTSGTMPGVPVPPPSPFTIPLNRPWLNNDLGYLVPPGTFVNFIGVIPGSHLAFASINLPADPSIIGVTISSAFALLDPLAPSSVGFVSAPKTTVIGAPAPAVTSVMPPTSPQSGAALLTISGDHFQPGATVTVGGTPATNVVVVNAATITATSPPGNLGPAEVRVTNPDTISGALAGGITYVANLVVSSIAPLYAAPGATVTISGSGFVAGLQLSVDGLPVPTATVTPNAVTFAAPGSTSCNATVAIVNPDQQMGSLAWNPAPSIQGVYNNHGSTAGSGLFFLLGAFLPGSTVTVAGVPAMVSSTNTALLVTAPPAPAGVQSVVVTGPNGCTAGTTYFYF